MSFASEEIARQPAAWRRAADAVTAARGLPQPGERVAVVGCGTSLYIAHAYAARRESRGLGPTDAFPASEFPASRDYDRYVVISRSGTTTEVIDFLRGRRGRGPALALTADQSMPVGTLADSVLELAFADERSVVQTLFATTALAALRSSLGEDVRPLADRAESALRGDLDPAWVAAEQLTFLGRGWAFGIAQEAALKLREASTAWTEAYPTMEYRHGPISITGPHRVAWAFGPLPAGLDAQIAATGGHLEAAALDPMADLIRVQRLAVAIAEARGLDPDQPRHLTRSVILP